MRSSRKKGRKDKRSTEEDLEVTLNKSDPEYNNFHKVENLSSHVWKYFMRNSENLREVLCMECNRLIFMKNAGTNKLVSHLKKKHGIRNEGKGLREKKKLEDLLGSVSNFGLMKAESQSLSEQQMASDENDENQMQNLEQSIVSKEQKQCNQGAKIFDEKQKNQQNGRDKEQKNERKKEENDKKEDISRNQNLKNEMKQRQNKDQNRQLLQKILGIKNQNLNQNQNPEIKKENNEKVIRKKEVGEDKVKKVSWEICNWAQELLASSNIPYSKVSIKSKLKSIEEYSDYEEEESLKQYFQEANNDFNSTKIDKMDLKFDRRKQRGPRGPYRKKGVPLTKERHQKYWNRMIKRTPLPLILKSGRLNKAFKLDKSEQSEKFPQFLFEPQNKNFEKKQKEYIFENNEESRRKLKNFIQSQDYAERTSRISINLLNNYFMTAGILDFALKKYDWRNFSNPLLFRNFDKICPQLLDVRVDLEQWLQKDKRDSFEFQEKMSDDNWNQMKRESQIPNVFTLCSKFMKQNYQRFGQVIRITKLKNSIISLPKQTTILLISGQDQCLNPALFGLIFLSKQNCDLYRRGLEFFFNTMNGKVPLTVIRQISSKNRKQDQSQDHLKQAFDAISKSNRIQITIIDDLNVKFFINRIEKMKAIMKAKNKTEIQIDHVVEIMQMYVNQKSKVQGEKLIKDYHKLTGLNLENFLAVPLNVLFLQRQECKKWIGFNLQISRSIKLFKILQPKLIDQESLSTFLQHIFSVEKKLIQDQRKSYRTFVNENKLSSSIKQILIKHGVSSYDIFEDNEELIEIYSDLSIQVFELFLINYLAAIKFVLIRADSKFLSFQSIFRPKKRSLNSFVEVNYVKFNLAQECWNCSCGYQFLMGIPCPHLIRIILLFKGSLRYYISEKWFITTQESKTQRSNAKKWPKFSHNELNLDQSTFDPETFKKKRNLW